VFEFIGHFFLPAVYCPYARIEDFVEIGDPSVSLCESFFEVQRTCQDQHSSWPEKAAGCLREMSRMPYAVDDVQAGYEVEVI